VPNTGEPYRQTIFVEGEYVVVQQATQLVSHQQAETRSAVERIAAFAAAARAQQLKTPWAAIR
jgi:hypothetical protein